MGLNLDNAIDVCLTCRRRFASIGEARAVFQELGGLTVDQSNAVARRRLLDPTMMRGLTMIARYACMALEWLEYHDQPLTQWHLQQLEAEFKGADPKCGVLKWELHQGAWEILRKVDWQPVAR
jgi:hypothetical protein